MRALRFGPARPGQSWRAPTFEPVTGVKLAAVCAIANSACDEFCRLFDRQLTVDLFEPVVVPTESQPALFNDALIFRGHGRTSDVLIVFRELAARRIVALAFREELEQHTGRISTLEEQVIERVARELATLCAPLCGELNAFARAHGRMEQYHCAAYFELRLGSPIDAVIGIGLSHDPQEPIGERIAPAVLADAVVNVRARLARSKLNAREVMRLRVGSVVPFPTKLVEPAQLVVGDTVLAHGECGELDGTAAFKVLTLTAKREHA